MARSRWSALKFSLLPSVSQATQSHSPAFRLHRKFSRCCSVVDSVDFWCPCTYFKDIQSEGKIYLVSKRDGKVSGLAASGLGIGDKRKKARDGPEKRRGVETPGAYPLHVPRRNLCPTFRPQAPRWSDPYLGGLSYRNPSEDFLGRTWVPSRTMGTFPSRRGTL